MATIHLTKTEFLTKVADYKNSFQTWKYLGDKPAIIDFYANWCGPCKNLSPILEELSDEYNGQIYIYKIDVDIEEELSEAFNIRTIPTLFFVPMQGKPQIVNGYIPKQTLIKSINEILLE